MHTYNDQQGSDEWLERRRGMVTASAVGQLIASRTLGADEHHCPSCKAEPTDPCRSKRDGSAIATTHPERARAAREAGVSVIEPARTPEAKTLTMLLVAERITGWTDPTFISDDMWRGIDDEPIARDLYSQHYAPVEQVGFIVEDRWGFQIGYSPDGLVGDDGLIEIKSRRSKAHLSTIIADQVPAANMAQLQCGLLVTGRKWIDYVSFCGGMPLWVKRVEPDHDYQAAILNAVAAFEDAATEIVNTYRARTANLHPTERRLAEMEISI